VRPTEKSSKLLRASLVAFSFFFLFIVATKSVRASDTPNWMNALTSVPLPEHDEKTDAVLLYAEQIVIVQPNGKIRRLTREAYRILRPSGSHYGTVVAFSGTESKVLSMHGWCLPATGKFSEVKDKDAIETSTPGVDDGELVTDVRAKILEIPNSEPGSLVASEVEDEESLFILQDQWWFQERIPVREARYTLELPPGWEYKTAWVNSSEIKAEPVGNNQWRWVVTDIRAIRHEPHMPPFRGVSAQMVISLIPPSGAKKGFITWTDVARWTSALTDGRREPSPEIKRKVAELTGGKTTTLAKMQALSEFVQRDIRYVAIELGIGGWQPHPARDIYNNHYGDCKDKATLLSTMLKEIGVESYYVVVNVARGAVSPQTPPQHSFNHIILAIHLPDDVKDSSIEAVYTDPPLGRLLIFDPTDDMTPLGSLRGPLQGSYALLVAPDRGELVPLPILAPTTSGVRRSAKLALNSDGTLTGQVVDIRYGDSASHQRYTYQEMKNKEDQIKPIENFLSQSVGTYQITKASIGNLDVRNRPFQFTFSFVVAGYAKFAGDLLLVRPRVLGEESSDVLETKEPRIYPMEFEGLHRDWDRVEIALPAGYTVDELPPPADLEYSFGTYHSKTEVQGNALVYTRTLEIRQLAVPVDKMDDLKKFYRAIANDERSSAVLKPISANSTSR
jgi:Domain of Unknown Function with PDB structure (DUF3857)/Transglutaminase-like superfamily